MKLDQLASDAPKLVDELMRHLQQQFYFDRTDKAWWHDQSLLICAITYPAKWLFERGMTREMPEARYRDLLMERVIQVIKRHGSTAKIHSFGRYFLHAVQEHMRHHGEEYYEAAKTIRSALGDIETGIRRAAVRKVPASDSTIADLAKINAVVGGRGGRKKKQQPAAIQEDLFGACTTSAKRLQDL